MPPSHEPPSHGEALCQLPVELQVSTPPSEHCTAPGVHEPVQRPLTHAWLKQGTAVPQAPVAWHVSTPLPEH